MLNGAEIQICRLVNFIMWEDWEIEQLLEANGVFLFNRTGYLDVWLDDCTVRDYVAYYIKPAVWASNDDFHHLWFSAKLFDFTVCWRVGRSL